MAKSSGSTGGDPSWGDQSWYWWRIGLQQGWNEGWKRGHHFAMGWAVSVGLPSDVQKACFFSTSIVEPLRTYVHTYVLTHCVRTYLRRCTYFVCKRHVFSIGGGLISHVFIRRLEINEFNQRSSRRLGPRRTPRTRRLGFRLLRRDRAHGVCKCTYVRR